MRLDVLILAIALFTAGTLVGRQIERHTGEAEAKRAAPAEGSAQDYIRQYSCWHAIVTGNYAQAKGCT